MRVIHTISKIYLDASGQGVGAAPLRLRLRLGVAKGKLEGCIGRCHGASVECRGLEQTHRPRFFKYACISAENSGAAVAAKDDTTSSTVGSAAFHRFDVLPATRMNAWVDTGGFS